jgi:NADPH-dependent F420 reductase
MRIALIGGTGDIGEGLALRWGLETTHEILVGSRTREKADERAREYAERLESAGKSPWRGCTRTPPARATSWCLRGGPYVVPTARSLGAILRADQILVSPAVSMERRGKFFFHAPPPEGSLALQIAGVLPERTPLVSALHTVPAHKLADLGTPLDQDVVCLGDHEDAKKTVMGLIGEIPGLHPLDGGPLAASSMVESITPLLINLAIANKRKNLAIKFV